MRLAALAGALLMSTALSAHAEVKVVASIKPVHSLVAAVMEGAGEPTLIVDGANSPHSYQLKPSEAQALQDADIVFWVGHEIETFLEEPLESLSGDAHAISLFEADGLTRLPYREGGAFGDGHDHHDHGEHAGHKDEEHGHDHAKHEEHGHDDHGHDEHAGHKHEEHSHEHAGHEHDEHKHDEDKHAHDDHAHDDHGHEKHEEHAGHDDHGHEEHAGHGHEGHNHGDIDAHIWLDPENARVIVKVIAEELSEHDPANAALYASNAAALDERLAKLVAKTESALHDVEDARFVVFHDAYRYFEDRFGLTAAGTISVNTEVPPGAARVSEIRELASENDVTCIFSEPQFNPAIVEVIAEGTGLRTAVLDPLGANLEPGPGLYEALVADMTNAFRTCLGGTS